MVETRFPESGLSAEYGDIVISEVSSELLISVNYLGNWVLSEKYFPDSAGKVAFKNLGKLAEDYFQPGSLSLTGGVFALPVTFLVSVDCDAEQESILKNVTIYPCVVDFSGTVDVALLAQIPLSRATQKVTAQGRKEFISFYGDTTITLYVVYRGVDRDIAETVEFATLANPDTIYTLDVSPAVIAAFIGQAESALVYYNLYSSADSIIRFFVSTRLWQFEKTLLFVNCFGAQESFTCTGDENEERQWTREYGNFNDRKINYKRELENAIKINTGYLVNQDIEVVEDLLNSDSIYMIDEAGLQEVTVLNEEFSDTSRKDEVKSVTFTYRLAQHNQFKSRYQAFRKPRVFTPDFDTSFE